MAQEDKELLLVDLSARLPYMVKIELTWWVMDEGTCINTTLEPDHIEQLLNDEDGGTEIKPYLRPMSSMTEEECIELDNIEATIEDISKVIPNVPYHIEVVSPKQIDWLNAHHFDYRNLIEKGLAIEVTEENNPYKE